MRSPKHYRLSTAEPLASGGQLQLSGNAAHYLTQVLRLGAGDGLTVFNRESGAFEARIAAVAKRTLTLEIGANTGAPETPTGLTVCFAPIRGGRMETIIEKATELGADRLQPVLTSRSVVDKVNLERAETITREAAEQCERTGWPDIDAPVKLLTLLGSWPADMPLIYGDESGNSPAITEWLAGARSPAGRAGATSERGGAERGRDAPCGLRPPLKWAVLAGPEGGFTSDEFAALARVKSAIGVGLGPRILRADTAVITLCAATVMAWGDWHRAPRFEGNDA